MTQAAIRESNIREQCNALDREVHELYGLCNLGELQHAALAKYLENDLGNTAPILSTSEHFQTLLGRAVNDLASEVATLTGAVNRLNKSRKAA